MNRIVTAYLEFAELQAMNRKPMYMADWISKLDDFLRLADHQVLEHAGKVSHEIATLKALQEYDSYSAQRAALPAPVESHFEQAISETKQLQKAKSTGNKRRTRLQAVPVQA